MSKSNDTRTDNEGTGIVGERLDKKITNEADHFETCSDCGQAFDRRELGEVLHHVEPGHLALPVS